MVSGGVMVALSWDAELVALFQWLAVPVLGLPGGKVPTPEHGLLLSTPARLS